MLLPSRDLAQVAEYNENIPVEAGFFSPSSPSVCVSFSSSFSSFSSGTTSQDQVRHQLEILTPISSNLGMKGTGLQYSFSACQKFFSSSAGDATSEVTENFWCPLHKHENFGYVGISQECTVYAQRPGSTFYKNFFEFAQILQGSNRTDLKKNMQTEFNAASCVEIV